MLNSYYCLQNIVFTPSVHFVKYSFIEHNRLLKLLYEKLWEIIICKFRNILGNLHQKERWTSFTTLQGLRSRLNTIVFCFIPFHRTQSITEISLWKLAKHNFTALFSNSFDNLLQKEDKFPLYPSFGER